MVESRRRLKITFLTHRPSLSGGARVIGDYAGFLLSQGHDVRVFTQPAPVEPLRRRLKAFLLGRPRANPPDNATFLHTLGDRLVILPQHGRPHEDDLPEADILIACFWNTAEHVASQPASKGAKAYFMQDYGAPGQPEDAVHRTWCLGLKMITISRYLQDEIARVSGAASILAPCGVDPSFTVGEPRAFRDGPPTVGFLFSTNEMKGSRYCIAAVEKARQTMPNLRVLSFGPKTPADPEAMPSFIEFRPRVSEAEARAIYARCDAWLFGSLREGFGLPILEAMAAGTPVIAASSAAAPDILAHGGGRLVPPGDADAMAAAITGLLALPPADWTALSQEAFRTASRYSIESARARFEDAIYAIVDGRIEEAARAATPAAPSR